MQIGDYAYTVTDPDRESMDLVAGPIVAIGPEYIAIMDRRYDRPSVHPARDVHFGRPPVRGPDEMGLDYISRCARTT